MLGTPLAITEGLVTLSAYACDTLSRPEGIIDHTVDDRPRDLERCALTKPTETMTRLNAPWPEQSPARPDGRILQRPSVQSVLPQRRLSMGGGGRFGRFAAAKGRFSVGRLPMRPWDGATTIPSFRLRRFLGR
jgi:hypothetical protein